MRLKKQKYIKPVAYKFILCFYFCVCGDVTTAACPLPPCHQKSPTAPPLLLW